jgi:T5SS/PEP-CTERM-associated repeat protein
MKRNRQRLAHGTLMVCAAMLFGPTSGRAVLTTNSYLSASGGPWDSGVISTWSAGIPSLAHAACVVSNASSKRVLITDTTTLSSLTISNLLISAPGGFSNTLVVSTTNTFTILQSITVGLNGEIQASNATIDVKGQFGGSVINNGAIILSNGASFLVTNTASGLDIGRGGRGAFFVNGGRLLAISQKVAALTGDKGTLTIAGGTNIVTSDGLFIGDSVHATGAVWVTAGALIQTNAAIYLGNSGSGRLDLSNGNVVARQLILGNTAGGAGTLTVNGGAVELPDFGLFFPLLLGQFAGGTGAVWITGGSLVCTNGTTRIGDSGSGMIALSNGSLLATRFIVGSTSGAGTLNISGGSCRLSGTGDDCSFGDAAPAVGACQLSGGEFVMTNSAANTVFIGNAGKGAWTQSGGTASVVKVFLGNGGGTGTLTMNGGLLTGTGTMSVGEGSGGTGTLWQTGGIISNTVAGSYIAPNSGTTGSMTISNGLAIYRDLSVGILGYATFAMAGGTLSTDYDFVIAGSPTGVGTMTQSGGWLITTNATGSSAGIVSIVSTGGTWLNGGLLIANGNIGTFTINGGTNIFGSGLTVGSSGGSGSVWVTSGKLIATNGTTTVGSSAFGQFTATGGVVKLRDVSIAPGSPAGSFTVAGADVLLTAGMSMGFGGTGTLTMSAGSLTISGDSVLGGFGGTGSLRANGGQTDTKGVTLGIFGGSGKLYLNGGVFSTTNLVAVSGPASSISFSAGTLNSSATAVTNAAQFVVGDAVGAAHFRLLGGHHAFANGLRIRNNATLSGCGTIASTVVIDAGGTVVIDCGTMTFTGSVTNNGLINAIHGATNFLGGIVNNGIILDAAGDYDGDGQSNLAEDLAGTNPTNSASYLRITSIAREGDDIRVTWQTTAGKTNALERTAGDASGNYSNDFAVLTNIITTGTTTNALDLGAATNGPVFFYRVRLVP